MNNFLNSIQSFFHSVTTNDRYATYEGDNPPGYSKRTGTRGVGPATRLTSDSDTLYRSPQEPNSTGNPYHYNSQPSSRNNSSSNIAASSSNSLNRLPYTPGMRSAQIGNGGNIPLQEYSDGAPPPPAPAISWKRIDRWMELNYPELYDQINEEATSLDLNEFESDLDCTLPLDVRDSFMIHDGQERGGRPCGVLFGITMLDLESVAEEWTHWKTASIRIANLAKSNTANERADSDAQATAGPSVASPPSSSRKGKNVPSAPKFSGNLSWLDHQESVPEGAIQRVYAHPAWIPLASDYLGNNIGVDLAPGPNGRWGQVILFGREYDRKYVVAPSWAAFLMTFADDLENGNHLINDEFEEGELSFRASNGRTVPYFDVLRMRVERLYGRKKTTSPYNTANAPNSSSQTNIAGPRETRTSSGSTPMSGRNISGPFRKPLTQDGRLISPLNSATHLPSIGLSKPLPTSKLSEQPLAANRTPSPSPLQNSQSADTAKSGSEQPEKSNSAQADESSEPTSELLQRDTDESNSTTAEDQLPLTPVTGSIKVSDNSPASIESHDEVDLLKDDLTEIVI